MRAHRATFFKRKSSDGRRRTESTYPDHLAALFEEAGVPSHRRCTEEGRWDSGSEEGERVHPFAGASTRRGYPSDAVERSRSSLESSALGQRPSIRKRLVIRIRGLSCLLATC